MSSTSNFYDGADYGLSYKEDSFLGMERRTPFSEISLATNPFTANQIQEVSNKLNTGAKALEVNLAFVDQQGSPAESIPDEHLVELRRLKELTKVDFTMHGALIEPTGLGRQNWDESQRREAERQLWISLQKSKLLDKEGNIVVTFHSSNGLPDPETKEMIKVGDEYKEVTTSFNVIDETSGKFGALPVKKHYFPGEENSDPKEDIKNQNKEMWLNSLQQTNYRAYEGSEYIKAGLSGSEDFDNKSVNTDEILKAYELYGKDKKKYEEIKNAFGGKYGAPAAEILESKMRRLDRGSVNLRDAYSTLKNLYDIAYQKTEQQLNSKKEEERKKAEEDFKKLKEYAKEMEPKIEYIEDPKKINEFSEEIIRGINILSNINTPQYYRPIKDFAIDKASETFSNLALKAVEKYGDKAPVISIENPPAGSGLSRAEDLKELIDETRKKFVLNATKKFEVSKEEAEKQAKKLIGATWDLGHINMLRKYGYDEDEKKKVNLVQQTETIAPYIKNVHLSDNFGMEHTELPMGMGNVPTKAHMDMIDKFQKQVKKVVETGNWYQHFKTTPLNETAAALGSGMFSGYGVGPSWSQSYGTAFTGGSVGYFAGLGYNPEVHHSVYGAGFSGLPTELGGQIQGRGGSRLSGTAME